MHTSEGIAYASVYLTGSNIGTTTDTAGNFKIFAFVTQQDSLAASYVGYQLQKIKLGTLTYADTNIVISLERGKLNADVVVTARVNKGLFLWRKIMAKKPEYDRYNMQNFGYEAYNKIEADIKNFNAQRLKKNPLLKSYNFIFDNVDSTSESVPFLPAYLIESVSDYAYQHKPERFYEHIKAANTKGFKNESITKMLGVMDQNVNVYGNFINVMDKDFVGPFNDNADAFYKFSVADTQVIGGERVYHFLFTPKNKGQNVFEGDAWVTAKGFHIQKFNLYLGKSANINFIERISVYQEFSKIDDSTYFLTRDKFYADFNVFGKNSLTLIGRKSTSYKNIVYNNDSLNTLLNNLNVRQTVTTAPAVNATTDADWQELRHDSLSINEQAIYTTIDKLFAMPKFQRLQKNLKFLTTGYTDVGNIELGPWFNWISSNNREGTRFRFDVGTNTGFNKHIYLHGYLAYGTRDQKFKGLAEAYWILSKKPDWFRLHASYVNDIDNGISKVGQVSQDNIFSLAIRKPSITRKFLQRRESRFEVFKEWGKGFSTELFLANRQFQPLQNLPFTDPLNPTVFRSNEVSLKLRFAYQEQFITNSFFRYSLGSKYPAVEMIATHGISAGGKTPTNYTGVSASVGDFMRISPFGTLTYKVTAGRIFGTAPFVFLENHPGNDIYYYNSSAYNLMTRFEYLSDRYAGVNVEHNIGSGIFRFTSITRKLKLRQFWNAKVLAGSLSNENIAFNNNGINGNFKTLNAGPYAEVGTGIDNILKVFRLDFVWRVSKDRPALTPGQKFGIFGSFQIQF